MDMKWIAVMVVGFAVALFAPLAVKEHGQAQCRIEAIKAGVEVDKIDQACNRK